MPRRFLIACLAIAAPAVACTDNARLAERICVTEPLTTDSGLTIEDLECGRGRVVERGAVVTVRYSGALEDGAPLPPEDGFRFPLGEGQTIPGWEEGIPGMRVGGTRRLVIPPELAFGASGVADLVPPEETLSFEVEMLDASLPRTD